MECKNCGKELENNEILYHREKPFCNANCANNWLKVIHYEQQKHEKIEKMAWEIYKDALYAKDAFGGHFLKGGMIQQIRKFSFKHAEEFYDYAKKQEENV